MDIRALRERQSLRLIDVAYHVNVTEATVRNWEHGRTIPKLKIDQFEKLLELYKCSFDELAESIRNTAIKLDAQNGNTEQN